MSDAFSQGRYQVRLDWGPAGAATLGADVVVVVDVLSFSTAVTVAVDRGTRVIPCPWSDERAAALAQNTRERELLLARVASLTVHGTGMAN